jgi:hypothetical protein
VYERLRSSCLVDFAEVGAVGVAAAEDVVEAP